MEYKLPKNLTTQQIAIKFYASIMAKIKQQIKQLEQIVLL